MGTQKYTSALTIQVLERLDQSVAMEWDRCCRPESYFPAAYLQALARSGLDCTFRYFVARRAQQVVGTSFGYLTRFPLSPLVHPRVFICGSPANFAFPLAFSPSSPDQEILHALLKAMIQEASTHHAAMIVFRDVNREISTTINTFHTTCVTLGLRRVPLFQQAWLTLCWPTFDDYLAALRSRYRELVRRDLRKVQQAQCSSLILPGSAAHAYIPELHRLWLQAYHKHRDRDQLLLPPSYFSEVLALPNCRVFLVLRHQRLLAFILTFEHASTLEAGHSGVDYAMVEHIPVHRYVEYEIIRYALDHRFERIDFGISHEANKQRLGCSLHGLSGYLHPLSPLARLATGLHADRWFLRGYGFAIAEAPGQGSQDGEVAPHVFRQLSNP